MVATRNENCKILAINPHNGPADTLTKPTEGYAPAPLAKLCLGALSPEDSAYHLDRLRYRALIQRISKIFRQFYCSNDAHDFTTFCEIAPNIGLPSTLRASITTESPNFINAVRGAPSSSISMPRFSAMHDDPTWR